MHRTSVNSSNSLALFLPFGTRHPGTILAVGKQSQGIGIAAHLNRYWKVLKYPERKGKQALDSSSNRHKAYVCYYIMKEHMQESIENILSSVEMQVGLFSLKKSMVGWFSSFIHATDIYECLLSNYDFKARHTMNKDWSLLFKKLCLLKEVEYK